MSCMLTLPKAHSPLVLTEMSNKRRHSMISKKSKYTEVGSDDDEDDDSDNECKY